MTDTTTASITDQLQELRQLVAANNKTILSVDDLHILTGYSKSHIYKLTWSKRIPYYKSAGGKMVFFKREEIDNWLCAHRIRTNEETASEAVAYCVRNTRGSRHGN